MTTLPIQMILVDNHRLFTEGLAIALSQNEDFYVINTFSNARLALEYIPQNRPDLIITDIPIPDMNGLLFIDKVHERYPNIKILIISMFEPYNIMDKVHGYMTKVATIQEVSDAIKSIVIHQKKYFKPDLHELKNNEPIIHNLTKREQEVVALIAKEYTVDQIAEALFISRTTVESHKKNIFLKLNVSTNVGLVMKAMPLGYLL